MGAAEVLVPQTQSISIGPQPGPQTEFLSTTADIAIYGGAAGGGKSFGLLLEPVRHYDNPLFGGVVFRRNANQVRNEGGLWDESMKLYPYLGAFPKQQPLEWHFPSGGKIKFAHLEYDRTVFNWQGAQIPFIGFDELTHFSEYQFFYMLSRNRSTSGVPGYIRATTNPDPDSWVRRFIDWWIDKDGYPIKERSGKIRWFIRRNDVIHWFSSREEVYEKFGRGKDVMPKSVTFISSSVYDNKILLEKDPGYLANLLALPYVERMRLEGGNWNIRRTAGNFFRREWFEILDYIPGGFTRIVRFWDRAATKPNQDNPDPDWTRGLLLYAYPNGTWLVGDLRSMRDSPGQVERLIKGTASFDTPAVAVRAQQDPGSAGVGEAENFVKMLAGYDVNVIVSTKDKATRAKPVSAQCEFGNVKILRAAWNEDFFRELESFSENDDDYAHDDIVDAFSGAFNCVSGAYSLLDAL